jgi:dTDP-4-amino-4,6-dideoxygalactose transaminase
LGINARYRDLLSATGIGFMPVPEWSDWNGWLSCVVFDDAAARDRAMHALDAQNIESRPLWKPLHLQPVFADAPHWVDGTSETLFRTGLCLPSGSVLSDADVDLVAAIVTGAA